MFKLRARKRIVGSLLAVAVLAMASVAGPAAATSSGSSARSSAFECPLGPGPAGIDAWAEDWKSHGITQCGGYDGAAPLRAVVQVIDLTAGARLIADSWEHIVTSPNPADNEFPRREIGDWATSWGVGPPVPGQTGQMFSVTNASFFTSISTPNTKLSLPFESGNPAYRLSHGFAIYNTDPGSSAAKKMLRITRGTTHNVQIVSFPTNYTAADVQAACGGVWYDCVGGYDPFVDLSGDPNTTNYRTFVGVDAVHGQNASRVFIITASDMTVAEADLALQQFGAVSTMQLDGGGSTHLDSWAGDFAGLLNRPVPTVLVVGYSPNP